jgi:hypothetical protein
VAERWQYTLSTYQGNLSSRAGQWLALQGRQANQGSGSNDIMQYEDNAQGKGKGEGTNSTGSLPPPPTITDIVLEVAHRLGYNNALYSQGWNQQPIFLQSFGELLGVSPWADGNRNRAGRGSSPRGQSATRDSRKDLCLVVRSRVLPCCFCTKCRFGLCSGYKHVASGVHACRAGDSVSWQAMQTRAQLTHLLLC